jgi:hypothetical protein
VRKILEGLSFSSGNQGSRILDCIVRLKLRICSVIVENSQLYATDFRNAQSVKLQSPGAKLLYRCLVKTLVKQFHKQNGNNGFH